MSRTITAGGNPVAVIGGGAKVGDQAPDFKLHFLGPNGLQDLTLADFAGNTLILNVATSLDTGVCAIGAKKFNDAAGNLPDNIKVLTVTTDLPWAQKRFCSENSIDKIQTASDHRDLTFGMAYGGVIEPFRALARSLFVVGPDGVIKHAEYLEENANEPNYEAALAIAKG